MCRGLDGGFHDRNHLIWNYQRLFFSRLFEWKQKTQCKERNCRRWFCVYQETTSDQLMLKAKVEGRRSPPGTPTGDAWQRSFHTVKNVLNVPADIVIVSLKNNLPWTLLFISSVEWTKQKKLTASKTGSECHWFRSCLPFSNTSLRLC